MKTYVNKNCPWEYFEQPPLNTKILLLTKDNQCVVGVFKGEPLPDNRTYKAWQGLPDRCQAFERHLGYL
jgi:hypothetical protein